MAINISELWDYGNPELSEQRFRAALPAASAGEAFILQTQIARTYGIRGNFSQAQRILAELEPQILNASGEGRVCYYLELGRTYASATHPPETQTLEAKKSARSAYLSAIEHARERDLDDQAIDMPHMMTFVDTGPEEQLAWNRKAMALMQSSSQPEAKKWAGSLHDNTGYALYLLGQYEEALAEFRLALSERERNGETRAIRIARWMIAWTLRAMGRLNGAIEIQLQPEKEWDEAGELDPYVFEELEHLYKALQQNEQADYYAARRKAVI